MSIWHTLILVATAVMALEASQNAREAHRHTHEIACHLGMTKFEEFCEGHHE